MQALLITVIAYIHDALGISIKDWEYDKQLSQCSIHGICKDINIYISLIYGSGKTNWLVEQNIGPKFITDRGNGA